MHMCVSDWKTTTFQRAPTLGGECYPRRTASVHSSAIARTSFNGHPPLGVNATAGRRRGNVLQGLRARFNGHPPLGVNATNSIEDWDDAVEAYKFQRAPTLGGECYPCGRAAPRHRRPRGGRFNGHPPLGVNATWLGTRRCSPPPPKRWFQRAPTLGGECYVEPNAPIAVVRYGTFQRAPTLGGECYPSASSVYAVANAQHCFNGHPPLGVNATIFQKPASEFGHFWAVSTGTHPWG